MSANESKSRTLHRQPDFEVVDEMMVPILRALTEAQRLEQAASIWRFVRDIYLASVREEHPDWSPEEVQREAARRLSRGAN
jgi:hypothetical protein